MAMYQMMNNPQNLSLQQILDAQVAAGGIILTHNQTRAEFLQSFYDYTVTNSSTNYAVPYSIWSRQNKA